MPSVDAIRAIPDPEKRARDAESHLGPARAERDMAALVLARPYYQVCEQYNPKIEAAKEADDDAEVRRLTAAKAAAMKPVTWHPVRIYRDTIHVSRGLFNRMLGREPVALPDWPDADRRARRATAVVERWEPYVNDARKIRDEAVDRLMRRHDGQAPLRNAEVARLLGVSTARVAQMRHGRR
jgi:DNA-binding transcriptional regulator YiaG